MSALEANGPTDHTQKELTLGARQLGQPSYEGSRRPSVASVASLVSVNRSVRRGFPAIFKAGYD